jgi:uncharacterized Zn finger protein
MMKATIEETRISCPICGHSDRKVYRREVTPENYVAMLCRCLSCDQIYAYHLDKTGQAVDGEST